jgi:hypothetical protein
MNNQEKYILDARPEIRRKQKFLYQPQTLLLFVAVLVLITQLLVWGDSIILHIGAFTIFIGNEEILYLVLAFLVLSWLLYYFTVGILRSGVLSWLHIGITVLVVLFFLLTQSWFLKSSAVPGTQSDIIKALLKGRARHMNINSLWGILLIIGQLAYVVNLISGYIYKRRRV